MKLLVQAAAYILATKYDIDAHGVEQFVAGLMYEFIGKDDLPDIEKCLTDESALEQEITNAISDISKGDLDDIIKGVEEIGQIIKELPGDLAECKEIESDVEKLLVWAAKFKNPVTLVVVLSKNLLLHWKEVEASVKKMETDWTAKEYYNAGEDVGDIVIEALGKPTTDDIEFENNMFLF